MSSTFGKFQLIKQIGGGRLSQVFQVDRAGSTDGLRIALKRVVPSLITKEAFVSLVVREAGMLGRLDHENLCRCHEMGVVDGCAFLTLDLVDGCTLRALMRRLSEGDSLLPTTAVVCIGQQLAAVLEYLHRGCNQPLVHLDLSPQNVMIDRRGRIKLIDFGISRYLDGQNPPPLSGQLAGTVGYMSPDQALGSDLLDPRADEFGLGILLWEMTWGHRLFRGNTEETWRRMRTGDVPRTVAPAERPDALLEIIHRMLAQQPSDRYSSLRAVERALGEVPSANSGRRTLGELVSQLMSDPAFDPYDAVNLSAPEPIVHDIPTGELSATDLDGPDGCDGYAELQIQVDHGEGTPAAQVRAVVPDATPTELPTSPFLEMLPETQSTA